jgi:hypothetical protein
MLHSLINKSVNSLSLQDKNVLFWKLFADLDTIQDVDNNNGYILACEMQTILVNDCIFKIVNNLKKEITTANNSIVSAQFFSNYLFTAKPNKYILRLLTRFDVKYCNKKSYSDAIEFGYQLLGKITEFNENLLLINMKNKCTKEVLSNTEILSLYQVLDIDTF